MRPRARASFGAHLSGSLAGHCARVSHCLAGCGVLPCPPGVCACDGTVLMPWDRSWRARERDLYALGVLGDRAPGCSVGSVVLPVRRLSVKPCVSRVGDRSYRPVASWRAIGEALNAWLWRARFTYARFWPKQPNVVFQRFQDAILKPYEHRPLRCVRPSTRNRHTVCDTPLGRRPHGTHASHHAPTSDTLQAAVQYSQGLQRSRDPDHGEPTKMHIARSTTANLRNVLARLGHHCHCRTLCPDESIACPGHPLEHICRGANCNRSRREGGETDSRRTCSRYLWLPHRHPFRSPRPLRSPLSAPDTLRASHT